ncbi:MAG: polysaccharide biosynthesis/export family protein, partial [Cyanobacteriota bacterium]|nr:polysaccharide biosynthesis/export family protein [Cyanobacteriota bacterium]
MSFLRRPGSSQQQCVAAVLAGGLLCLPFAAVAQAAPQGSTALAMNDSLGSVLKKNSYRYRLGPGDQLSMTVFKMEGYEAKVEVLSDGTINLPRIGTIEVWGLTLEEAKQSITSSYAKILRRPLVHLDLVAPRPIKVTVTGDVETPGVFSLPAKGDGGWPTLVDVVRKAGGIGATGDLSRLELIRPSQTPGVEPTRYSFDYLSILRDGGHAPIPLIYDGDSIRVYTAENLSNSDMITAAASNFAPDTIKVNVIGEVAKPGVVEVPSN